MLLRLLLLPLLTPLLAVLLVGAINPRPWVSLQLLTWRSPALPLGAWISGVAAAGAGLSAGAAALALQGGAAAAVSPGRRQVRRRPEASEEAGFWPEPEAPASAAAEERGGWGIWAGPSRAPSDPPPTVSVPFRVLRRGAQASARPSGPASNAPAPTPAPTPAAPAGDGWDSGPSDDW